MKTQLANNSTAILKLLFKYTFLCFMIIMVFGCSKESVEEAIGGISYLGSDEVLITEGSFTEMEVFVRFKDGAGLITIRIEGDAEYGIDYRTEPDGSSGLIKMILRDGRAVYRIRVYSVDDEIQEADEEIVFLINPHPTYNFRNTKCTVTIVDND